MKTDPSDQQFTRAAHDVEAAVQRQAAVDEICDSFEENLRAGKSPQISELINEAADELRDELFQELLLCELEHSTATGARGQTEAVYLSRYPEFRQQISDAFAETQQDCPTVANVSEETRQANVTDVGPYRILDSLGEGGMGSVFRAEHTTIRKIVAIKFLPATLSRNEKAVARFRREMITVGQLDHPNLLRASHAETDGHQHYIVMEYLDGFDLAKVSRAIGYLDVADACEIIRQAAVGVQYLHDRGIVHRDVKPSNVMLCSDGNPTATDSASVKVIDFGLARADDFGDESLTASRDLFGTFQYMAPEQFRRGCEVNGTADIYALGATLYRLLSGRLPYPDTNAESLADTMMAISTGRLIPIESYRPEIPSALAATIRRMLAKNPAERIQSAAEVADALQPFASGHAIGSINATVRGRLESDEPLRTPLTMKPASSTARRKAVTAVLLLAAFVGVGFAVARSSSANSSVETLAVASEVEASSTEAADRSEGATIGLGRYRGISNLEAAFFRGDLYVFFTDVEIFGISARVGRDWKVRDVRQSHFVGRRSFCGLDPKTNPPFLPVFCSSESTENDLHVFLPAGLLNDRRKLADICYYRVADEGVPELKQPWKSDNVFDYYLPDASGAPGLQTVGGKRGSVEFPVDANRVAVAFGGQAVYVICTRTAATIEIFRVPWNSAADAGRINRVTVNLPTAATIRHSAAVMVMSETEEPQLIWTGSVKETGNRDAPVTLTTRIPISQLSGSGEGLDELQWQSFTGIPLGEIKLSARGDRVEAFVLDRSGASPTLNRFGLSDSAPNIRRMTLPTTAGHFAVTQSDDPNHIPSLLITLLEEGTYNRVKVIPLP